MASTNSWIQALREWNTDDKWCVPKKGTEEYKEVMVINRRLNPKQKKEKLTSKQRSDAIKAGKKRKKQREENKEIGKAQRKAKKGKKMSVKDMVKAVES